jgi:hypothetical protein
MILDAAAQNALVKMYVREIDLVPSPRMKHWLHCHCEGVWFRALAGLRADTLMTEERLRQIASRILGIANANDSVTPAGSMMNTLQGLRRDTGIEVVEFSLGLHESPFVSDNYGHQCRHFVTEVLDETRYGQSFDRFIQVCGSHFGQAD